MDNDGIANHLDPDSDGDGCNDVLEAGFTDDNVDGILADLPTTVDANGQVTGTNMVDGYTAPADNDSSGTADFMEDGAAPSIVTQPGNLIAFAGSGASFLVSANNTDTYQWQISTDGGIGFSDLADGGMYSNTATPTLNISAVELYMNNYRYRVIASNSAFTCSSPIISNAANLIVKVRTVISNRRITYRVKKN